MGLSSFSLTVCQAGVFGAGAGSGILGSAGTSTTAGLAGASATAVGLTATTGVEGATPGSPVVATSFEEEAGFGFLLLSLRLLEFASERSRPSFFRSGLPSLEGLSFLSDFFLPTTVKPDVVSEYSIFCCSGVMVTTREDNEAESAIVGSLAIGVGVGVVCVVSVA